VTGSYAGTDGGASSEMTLTSNMTSAAITKACDGGEVRAGGSQLTGRNEPTNACATAGLPLHTSGL
jgi:hypothetical protein